MPQIVNPNHSGFTPRGFENRGLPDAMSKPFQPLVPLKLQHCYDTSHLENPATDPLVDKVKAGAMVGDDVANGVSDYITEDLEPLDWVDS